MNITAHQMEIDEIQNMDSWLYRLIIFRKSFYLHFIKEFEWKLYMNCCVEKFAKVLGEIVNKMDFLKIFNL